MYTPVSIARVTRLYILCVENLNESNMQHQVTTLTSNGLVTFYNSCTQGEFKSQLILLSINFSKNIFVSSLFGVNYISL